MQSIARHMANKGKSLTVFMLLLANLWCQLMPIANALSFDSSNSNTTSSSKIFAVSKMAKTEILKKSSVEHVDHCGGNINERVIVGDCCDSNAICENNSVASSLLDFQLTPDSELYILSPIELVYLQQQCSFSIEAFPSFVYLLSRPRIHLVNCVQLN